MKDLVEHVIVVDNTNSGRVLRWLASDPNIISDNPPLRLSYMELYDKVFSFGGDVHRTARGPRIIIPLEQWKNWSEMDDKSQEDFTYICWMQSLQFNRAVFNNALRGDYSTFRTYIVDLLWESGGYRNLNSMVHDEYKANENWALEDTLNPYWVTSDLKPNIYLPNSRSLVCWDMVRKGWYRSKEVVTWPELTKPDTWSTTTETNNLWEEAPHSSTPSAWGSPVHSPGPLSPYYRPITPSFESDSDSVLSTISDVSIASSCHPSMIQSQFLAL